jgi:hypothetical protein
MPHVHMNITLLFSVHFLSFVVLFAFILPSSLFLVLHYIITAHFLGVPG